MTSKPGAHAQLTKIRPDEYQAYQTAGYVLMPGHRFDAVQIGKDGKPRKLGKAPRDRGWTERNYNTSETIRVCAKGNLNAGVQLRGSDLVLDVDPRRGGMQGLERLCAAFGIDRAIYPAVITGSGGLHLYGSKPDNVKIVGSLAEFAGVEFKTRGQQVIAAGAVHPDTGKHYCFDAAKPPLTAERAAFPTALINAITRPTESTVKGGGQYSLTQLQLALDCLDPEEFRDHDAWLQLMMSAHHATAGDGRDIFTEWSARDPQYADDSDIVGQRWDSLSVDRTDASVTYRTLNKLLADRGFANFTVGDREEAFDDFEFEGDPRDDDDSWLDGEEESPDASELFALKVNSNNNRAPDTFPNACGALVRSGIVPAWNELAQNIVFLSEELPWPEDYGRVLTENLVHLTRAYLTRRFQGVGYEPSTQNVMDGLRTLALLRKFNPILQYLDSLKWDGVPRVEKLFSVYFGCGDDAYTRGVGRTFMIGAVRRMRQPGVKLDTMPILKGPQGWGKSTGLKVLFGAEWFSDAQLGDLRGKDAAMALRGKWLQEFSEIESLSKHENATLKAFLSRPIDRQRDPYARLCDDVPRRTVFCGTTNESDYLRDATGGRRFWPLQLQRPVDLEGLKADRDQLWAEAAHLESIGESEVLPPELWPVAAERQAAETAADPWQDELQHFLDQRAASFDRSAFEDDTDADDSLPPHSVHAHELYDALQLPPSMQGQAAARRVRAAMEGLGWIRRDSVRILRSVRAGYVRERPEGVCR